MIQRSVEDYLKTMYTLSRNHDTVSTTDISRTLKVAETHRADRMTTSGVYSIVRHPQYLAGLLAQVGISFLFSAGYSLLSAPLMVLLVFLISKKEENELFKEFGKEYRDYAKKVPMFLPRIRKCH
jgi:protein-S-isoprenylcysteine O-methyltransferase Ste14